MASSATRHLGNLLIVLLIGAGLVLGGQWVAEGLAAVVGVGIAADRTLEVPKVPTQTGWWTGGAAPGRPGPTVIVGHVDSRSGPAVFARLSQLGSGDRVAVVSSAGRAITYRVDSVRSYPKSGFPTELVYGPSKEAALRLITCGGSYDSGAGGYQSNVVVFGSLVKSA